MKIRCSLLPLNQNCSFQDHCWRKAEMIVTKEVATPDRHSTEPGPFLSPVGQLAEVGWLDLSRVQRIAISLITFLRPFQQSLFRPYFTWTVSQVTPSFFILLPGYPFLPVILLPHWPFLLLNFLSWSLFISWVPQVSVLVCFLFFHHTLLWHVIQSCILKCHPLSDPKFLFLARTSPLSSKYTYSKVYLVYLDI